MAREPTIQTHLPQMRASYDWPEAFKVSSGPPFSLDDVAFVVASAEGANDEAAWIAVFALNDGRYAAIDASCDYTGWDCQAGGSRYVGATLADVVRFGLTDDGRRRLGFDVEQREDEPGTGG